MKNYISTTLVFILMSCTIAWGQTKKPTTTKKPLIAKKSTKIISPKTTTKTTTTTTTSSNPSVKPTVGQKKTTTTNPAVKPAGGQKKKTITPKQSIPTSTTTTQSKGPSIGENKKKDKVEVIKEPKYKRIRGVRFGVRVEASQFIPFETGADVAFSPGFNAGLIVNIPLNEKFSIQPEVLYAMGIQQSNEIAGSFEKFTTGSILTPVTLKINLGKGSTKFMVNVGGYANYYLSSISEETVLKGKTSTNYDLTGTDRFSYGAVLGLGVKLNKSILIEARSFYDLKNTTNKSIIATLGIGYLF